MTALREAAQQALEAWDSGAGPLREAEVFEALRAALAQEQAGPTGKQDLQVESVATVAENATTQQRVGDAPPSDYRRGYWDGFAIGKREGRIEAEDAALAQEQAVTDDMRSAVRWAPSSAYWSDRLREFFGPDAREGIDALERRLAEAQEPKGKGNLPPPLQAEPDLSRCPQCNGPADNGHDRSIPPSPYLCTTCMAESCPNCASLEAQNTELDRKLAKMEQAEPVQEPIGYLWPTGRHPEFRFTQQKRDGVDGTPLYTAPPRRTMVPLTAQQLDGVIERHVGGSEITDDVYASMEQFARAIEKASWEKNQ